jgi:outer membrane beta-barrel protein
MRAKATAALVFAALLVLPLVAFAQDEDPGKLAAVQKRKYRLDHEIFLQAGLQPLDAFTKGAGVTAGYDLHFSDILAWEILRGTYSFRLKTGLRDQLQKDFGVAPTAFEELEWMVGSALMITPFYGKLSLLNSAVTHAEIFIVIGATVAAFPGEKLTFKPGPQLGIGLRFFLAKWCSIRFDTRYHYLFAKKQTEVLDLSLGLSFSLGGTD